MFVLSLLSISLIFLIGTAFLVAFNVAMRRMHLQEHKIETSTKLFFYRPIHVYFLPDFEYEGLLCANIAAQSITRFFYIFTAPLLLLASEYTVHLDLLTYFILVVIGFIVTSFVFADYLPRIVAAKFPETVHKFCAPIASLFMLLAFPITYVSLKLFRSQFRSISFEEPLTQTKREIIDIIQKTKVGPELNVHEKKLIESVLRFKDRIAREVMVPRVDVFSLAADTPIKEAVKLIEEEGYSRIPVYRNTVDNIVGVLMYKDVLNTFMKYVEKGNDLSILEAPVESIQKGILYTPETKKISNLLLEFRKKKVHLAIVVDEYGGTEGIVSIEDILEEIVGEIADEYDEEEEELFFAQHDGSWIVDARMNILDAEQQLGIIIPQEGDYDTIGGYIFHCTGAIPSKGLVIHQEEFQIEILRSNERRVEKVRIKPITKPEDDEDTGQHDNPEKSKYQEGTEK
ncbi:MAG: Magnesium and cobalt efflux protein CorC [Chlamydiae bacterium]|nr:Magnesium and cobalt efflux protein CorC [Chlamydiota bacterium]